MSHELLHDVMVRLAQLTREALAPAFPHVSVSLSDLSRSADWAGSQNAVYLVPYGVTLNEQNLRTEATRTRIPDPAGGDDLYRFYRAPLPLTLHALMVPCTDSTGTDLKLLGRLYQRLHEQPVLTLDPVSDEANTAPEAETRLTLSPDTRVTQEQLAALFQASRVAPRLAVPCLIRCLLKSDQVMREARPSRSIQGNVRKS